MSVSQNKKMLNFTIIINYKSNKKTTGKYRTHAVRVVDIVVVDVTIVVHVTLVSIVVVEIVRRSKPKA